MTGPSAIGASVPRSTEAGKVTGETTYTADFALPGMLWGALARSPLPHAHVVGINTDRARAMSGVHAVITALDVPNVRFGRSVRDRPLLAWDRVRFIGEGVAAVAAETLEEAREAAQAIEVEYEDLPAVFDMDAAVAESAPLLHPEKDGYERVPRGADWRPSYLRSGGSPEPVPADSNVFSHVSWTKGDAPAALERAAHVYERTFTTPRVHQMHFESHACVIDAKDGGDVDVWSSNKAPYQLQVAVAAAAGVEPSAVNIHGMPLGGDFGAKGAILDEAVALFLSRATGRPVKMLMSHIEELAAANPRHESSITVRVGVDDAGEMIGWHSDVWFNAGAYAGMKPGAYLPLVNDAAGVYRTPNVRIDCHMVYTNTVPGGHFRGPGQAQGVFAAESMVDIIARDLGIDPLEYRLRHVVSKGDTSPVGEDWGDALAGATLAEAAAGLGWTGPRPPGVGRGIAVCEHHAIGGPTSGRVTLEPSGQVLIHSPAFDNGAGFYTVLRQMLSAELGIDIDRIAVVPWDTKGGSGDYGVGGSRTTNGPGQFALAAGRQLLAQLREYAIERLSAPGAEVTFDGAGFSVDGHTASLEQIAAEAPVDLLVATVEGGVDEVSHTGFAALGAEVEIDAESGELTVRKLVGAYDSGRVLNPMLFNGQVSGATVQGLGYALMEQLQVEDGRVVTPTLADFKIPTFADLPPFEFVTLEQGSSQSDGPFNMKAIGEHPVCTVAPAIANAIEDAVGVRLADLPLTAERLYQALRAAKA